MVTYIDFSDISSANSQVNEKFIYRRILLKINNIYLICGLL